MNASEGRFVYLRGGLIVPAAAYLAALRAEQAGVKLWLEDGDVIAEGRLTDELRQELRTWKRHIVQILQDMTDDSHLHDSPKTRRTA